MGFWSDVLKIGGAITAPVLAATGVGLPLAIGIGAVAAGAGAAAAGAIERDEAKEKADRAAADARRRADEEAERQRQEAQRQREAAERQAQSQREHAALPNRIVESCQSGNIANLASLLQQLDNEQFENLGARPLAACASAQLRAQVQALLDAEDHRRYPSASAAPTPRPGR